MKHIIYAIAAIIIVLQFKTCFIKSGDPIVIVDTVEVIKTIPTKQNTFKKDSLVYVYVNKYIDTSKQYEKLFKQLKEKYNNKTDSITILRELLQVKQTRKYTEAFNDTILDAEVVAYTTGYLDSLQFKYKTKPLEVKYNEITKYISPRYRVLGGADIRTNGAVNSTVLGVNLGIQTRKGSIYTLGYDTGKNIKFSTYVNLFEKY